MPQNPGWPLVAHQACFTTGGKAAYPATWDDLTQRVTAYSLTQGKQFELDHPQTSEASYTVRDVDEALNPANTTSPWNTGGKSLIPFRWIRSWHMWPLTGNMLNSSNDAWATLAGASGSFGDTASFEGGTIGTWTPVSGCTATVAAPPGVVWGFDWALGLDLVCDVAGVLPPSSPEGARSMLVTWATTAGGSGAADLSTPTPPLLSGQTYTASLSVYIASGPAVTVWCNGNTATSTATTGVWQRVTVTFVADSTITAGIGVYAAGPTTAGQQVWIDDVQLEAASSASTFTRGGPTVYPWFGGYIERYPVSWRAQGFEGWTNLLAIDARSLLGKARLQDVIVQDCLQDNPLHAWPLQDAAGQVTAWDAVTFAPGGLTLVPAGAPRVVTTTYGASNAPGVDSATCLSFAPTTPGSTFAAVADWTTNPIPGPWTVEAWIQCTTVTRQMRALTVWTSTSEEVGIQVDAAGTISLIHVSTGGAVDATVTTPGWYGDGAWHHVAVTATWDGTSAHETLYVDGQQIGATSRVTGAAVTAYGLMAGYARGSGTDSYRGLVGPVAVYPSAVPAARVASHWLAGRTGFAGDDSGTRIGRVLAWVGWRGPTVLPSGGSRHGPAVAGNGKFALDVAEVADTERGDLMGLTSGHLALLPRNARFTQPAPLWVFGENTAAGEIPYLADGLSAETDPTYLYNSITVTKDFNGVNQIVENTALDRWTLTLVGSRHVITLAESGVQIGCHSHPITQWLAEYKEIGLESGYSAEQIDEYGELLRKAEAVAALMAPGGAA